jgi:hypothetical protein
MIWWLATALFVAWFVLRFIAHQKGMVHLLLLSSIGLFVIQMMAYRKTKYQRDIARKVMTAAETKYLLFGRGSLCVMFLR